MRILKRILLLLVVVALVTLALTYLWFSHTYSEGNRAGTLVKISERGYLFKTYEGALNTNPLGAIMSGNAGDPNNGLWEFSVTDPNVYQELQKYEGTKVSLHYREVIKNMPWQGDTRYFVDGVEQIVEPQRQPTAVPPPTTTNPTQTTTTPQPATNPQQQQQQQQQNPATTTHP